MDSQLDAVRHRIRKAEDEIVVVKQDLAAAEHAQNAERAKSLFDLLLSLNNQLSGLQEKENILLRSQAPNAATPAGDAAIDIASLAQVEMVEAETDDLPVKQFDVPRNQYGQLCVDSIEKFLAGSGQILVSIGNGYPACKDGWTLNSYSAIPIQLHVSPKPVDDEGFKLKDLKLKYATLMLAICFGIVWIIYSGIWGRSSGNPPTG